MSEINLILLGLIQEGPISPYQINKVLDSRHARAWLRISEPAVYRNIRKLADAGYLERRVEGVDAVPVRNVYTITPAGAAYFHQLMAQMANESLKYVSSIDALLAHVHLVSEAERLLYLRTVEQKLREKQRSMANIMDMNISDIPASLRHLHDLHARINATTLAWIQEQIAILDEDGSHSL